MPEPDSRKILPFKTPEALDGWLRKNHARESELWVKIYKKQSGLKSVTWNEVVIECLRWGWIDGLKKPLDDSAYLQRITPRRPKSIWSRRNCEHVKRLLKEDRMEEPGLAKVEAARKDGRWDRAYAPQSEMRVPQDFLAAIELDPNAKNFFASLSRTNKHVIAFRLETARKAETREKRFRQFLQMMKDGQKPV